MEFEELHIPELSPQDREIKRKRDLIFKHAGEKILELHEKIVEEAERLQSKHGVDACQKSSFYHILIGSAPARPVDSSPENPVNEEVFEFIESLFMAEGKTSP